MAKKECSKGHKYDSAIYGDNCPFCPSQGGTLVNEASGSTVGNFGNGGTEVNNDIPRTQVAGGGATAGTIPMSPKGQKNDAPVGGTVIRPVGGGNKTGAGTKKLVGLLVTYSSTPTGQVFNIYEGRNYVGRDLTCDVSINSDSQISGKHFSILYRSVDNKFKFKDEQSSNGTFVNDILEDDGELSNFDIIKIGETKLIFIAIPNFN